MLLHEVQCQTDVTLPTDHVLQSEEVPEKWGKGARKSARSSEHGSEHGHQYIEEKLNHISELELKLSEKDKVLSKIEMEKETLIKQNGESETRYETAVQTKNEEISKLTENVKLL